MKPVAYFEYFQQLRLTKFESTQQVVDSITMYDRLVNYRLHTTRSNEYYFLVCTYDELCKQHDYPVVPEALQLVLRDFETELLARYPSLGKTKLNVPICVRDTYVALRLWSNALDRLTKDSTSEK
jgi:hypothetical protein